MGNNHSPGITGNSRKPAHRVQRFSIRCVLDSGFPIGQALTSEQTGNVIRFQSRPVKRDDCILLHCGDVYIK